MINEFKLLVTSRYYGVPRSELRFAEQMVSQDFFKKCDGVLDIGANQGMFSTAMALTTTNVPIHAFEPLPSLQAKLRARVGRFPAVTVHASALGAAQGSADLNFGAFDEASSLLPMDQKHEEFFPGSSPTGKVRVDVITVDQFLALRPALRSVFMKLDVQGFELEVLSGARQSLGRIGFALVEVSFEELYKGGASGGQLISAFFSAGFKLAGFFRPLYRPKTSVMVSCDCLFLRRGHE